MNFIRSLKPRNTDQDVFEHPNGFPYGKFHELPDGIHIDCDNNQFFFQNGKVHREDGPAEIHASGRKIWVEHGQFHRIDGPAIEYENGACSWYYKGRYCHDVDCWGRHSNMTDTEEFVLLKLKYG